MKNEQFTRASEIVKSAEHISKKIEILEKVVSNPDRINQIGLRTDYIATQGEYHFYLGYGQGLDKTLDNQPLKVRALIISFVSCLLDAYKEELASLENEFANL